MFCSHCGKQIPDNAYICVGCGNKVQKEINDYASAGWWWLGFLIPMAGFIIWACLSDSSPNKAKKAGKGAIAGLITSVAFTALFYLFYFIFIIAMAVSV